VVTSKFTGNEAQNKFNGLAFVIPIGLLETKAKLRFGLLANDVIGIGLLRPDINKFIHHCAYCHHSISLKHV
jgi:hypothetical protein